MRLLARTLSWLQDWGHRRARQRMFVELGHRAVEGITRDHGVAPPVRIRTVAARTSDPRSSETASLKALSA